MSVGTAIFLIFLIVIAAVAAWYFLVRRPSVAQSKPAEAVTRRMRYADTVPGGIPVGYTPTPPVIIEQPVYVQPYRSPMNDVADIIIAEEIIHEIHEERREERFEEMREERYEEPSRYEAPDNGGGWGNGGGGGDFGSGDTGGF